MRLIDRDILKLAIPSILANITVPIVGMADVAVAGHLDGCAETLIGGVAIGSMLFDLLYWNFFFLRIGTGGLAAQALGRGRLKECADVFSRALGIAVSCALVLLVIQWGFVDVAFKVIGCTPEVRELASQYFFIRIWAAPATMSLMAFKGWFIGMQDTVSSMITDLVVNGVNILMSIILALGFRAGSFHYAGMGFAGIATGTVIAQYSGLLSAVLLLFFKYRKKVFPGYGPGNFLSSFRGGEMKKFFSVNANLFVRSLCFILIYMGFTMISANYGDMLLSVGSILMKLLMIFSYFTDGFSYAGEALAGKYIGAGDRDMFRTTVKHTFVWSMGVALLFVAVYQLLGVPMLRMMTSDEAVVSASEPFLWWLLLMPVFGCAAFTWDGIYVGATASAAIRNGMILATIGFFATYFGGMAVVDAFREDAFAAKDYGYYSLALQVLMGGYFMHLLVRTVYLSLRYKKDILTRNFN